MTGDDGITTLTLKPKTRIRLAILKQKNGYRSMDELLNKLLDEKEGRE